jgi:N-acyl-D-aspartate/D-glutamate deacylase
LVIRNGLIVDGTGAPAFEADLAIDGGVISAVGDDVGPGAREIDAAGQIVTPGFVDVHTHYDGQVTWDPHLTPSGWHGVTTVVMGNCGVGFAPVHKEDRAWVIGLMEGVEDIPGAALTEGIRWSWETFPEYLDALDRDSFAIDVATQIPHGPLRVYVMGERGAKNEPATPADVARMGEIVREAIEAGALGFSTSRTLIHRGSDGELVPGTFADRDELFGIGKGLAEAKAGVFQMTSNHVDMADEFVWMRALAEETQRPVLFNLLQTDQAPDLWKTLLRLSDEAAAEGVEVVPQVAGRPQGILMSWQGTAHPFVPYPSYQAIANLPWPERLAKLRDPETRATILADTPANLGDFFNFITRSFNKMFPLGAEPDYEPTPDTSVAAIAQRTGKPAAEIAYDMLLADDGNGLLYFPIFNYSGGDLDVLHTLLNHPRTRISLADGGAHVGAICDASIQTFMLTHWVKGRTRGQRLGLEHAIRMQTRDTAWLYGLRDRGVLAPGFKADVNVIDLENLTLHAPEIVYDLPAGGRRFVQKATGYTATVLNGQVTFENGEPTGALPGGLLRGAREEPSLARV